MSKLKIGIIGCGGIANGKHMPALAKNENVEMVAFCDIIKEKAEKAAKEFGTPDAKVFVDYRELCEVDDIDVIHVCTPNNMHADPTICALEHGKHVMCEKPMAKTAADASRMLDAAKRTGKKLTIGYQNRFRPDSLYLKRVCDEGGLGDIYYAKAHAIRRRAVPTWGVFIDEEKQGGGPLIDIGTHALDLTLWMMNNYDVKSVRGTTFKKLRNQTETGNYFGDWDPEKFTTEDSAFGFIEMKNGATIIIESSWALNTLDVGEAQTSLCGTLAGADMCDGLRINTVEYGKQIVKKPDLTAGGVDFFGTKNPTAGELESMMWIDSILKDTDPLVRPEQALVVSQILEAVYTSANTGKLIEF